MKETHGRLLLFFFFIYCVFGNGDGELEFIRLYILI